MKDLKVLRVAGLLSVAFISTSATAETPPLKKINPDALIGLRIYGYLPGGIREPATGSEDFLHRTYGGDGAGESSGGGAGRGRARMPTSPDNADQMATDQGCSGVTDNPVVIASGNKLKQEVDFTSQGEWPLEITRTYNKAWTGQSIFGKAWLSGFDYKIAFTNYSGYHYPIPGKYDAPSGNSTNIGAIKIHRPDGAEYTFHWNAANNRWEDSKPLSVAWMARNTTATAATGLWILHNEDLSTETYNDLGHLLSIVDAAGIGWALTYKSYYQIDRVTHTSGRFIAFTWLNGRVNTITDPAGNIINYGYNATDISRRFPIRARQPPTELICTKIPRSLPG